ncbi:NAD+ kinase [Synchytrium microbalum]|uniref:NAD+ kinase n=1 Tax=Synchytrium microbalum TaxID=1806994 RepID=A0A507CDY5_9FUNG|nr:NAD+ kinase [Synchytrium microbalum]TPX36246.1 NAD+ kinase [Synchytrium microbalum]
MAPVGELASFVANGNFIPHSLNMDELAASRGTSNSPFPFNNSPSLSVLNDRAFGEKMPILTPGMLSENAVEVRRTAKNLGRALMKLEHPNSVMLIAKLVDVKIIEFTRILACHLIDTPRACGISGLKVFIDAKLKNHPYFNYNKLIATHPHYAENMDFWSSDMCKAKPESVDFIITLGGDGTVLFSSFLFQKSQVPPVIPFHLGSLGFLTNFNVADIRDVLERVIGCHGDGVRVNMRMRLKCEVWRQSYASAPTRGRGGDNERIKALRESHQRTHTPNGRAPTNSTQTLSESDLPPSTNSVNGSSPNATPTSRARASSTSSIAAAPASANLGVSSRPRSPMPPNSLPTTPAAPGTIVESPHDYDLTETASVFSEASFDQHVSNISAFNRNTDIPNIVNVLDSITPSLTSQANMNGHDDWNASTGRRGRGLGDAQRGEPTYVKSEEIHILNDLVVDRGPSAYMSQLELFVDNRHLTTVQADGLVLSGPTGSTAYSLSAGGSVVHPECPAILVTPICPHTLSFRPLILPDSCEIRISVPHSSRNTAFAAFDGRHRIELLQGDYITISMSPYPMPTVCAEDQSLDWFESLRRCLHWNERTRQKGINDESPTVNDLEEALYRGPERAPSVVPHIHGTAASVSSDMSSPPRPCPLEPVIPADVLSTSISSLSTSFADLDAARRTSSGDDVEELGFV